jgi:hypothetical protein
MDKTVQGQINKFAVKVYSIIIMRCEEVLHLDAGRMQYKVTNQSTNGQASKTR